MIFFKTWITICTGNFFEVWNGGYPSNSWNDRVSNYYLKLPLNSAIVSYMLGLIQGSIYSVKSHYWVLSQNKRAAISNVKLKSYHFMSLKDNLRSKRQKSYLYIPDYDIIKDCTLRLDATCSWKKGKKCMASFSYIYFILLHA